MEPLDRTVERKLARIASSQWGVVTTLELLLAGVSKMEIRRRVQNGLLIRVHRAVYRGGHTAWSVEASYMAAVKACGKGAVLCGRAAAYLQGLLRTRKPPPPEVMCPTERRIAGIKTKRCRNMAARKTTRLKGIPLTCVPETLVDLAATEELSDLARACHEAGVKHRTTPAQVKAVLARRPTAPGSKNLMRIMSGGVPVSLSKLERAALQLLERHGIERPPEVNRLVGEHRVDLRWPGRLTVELDGFRFHNSRYAWDQDRKRERAARKRGEQHCRYGYSDVFEDPRELLAELREILQRGSRTRRSTAS